MEEQIPQSEESPEEILAFVKKILSQNRGSHENDQYPQNENDLNSKIDMFPLILDEKILDDLQQYVDFQEEENKQNQIEIEQPEQQIENNEVNQVIHAAPFQEKTYEEKEKWIDEVLKVDGHDQDGDDENNSVDNLDHQMQDESEESRNKKDDIYEMEKEFFESIKKAEREEYEKRQAQLEKNRKLYEEIVGEKHRKVQMIILSSTSSSCNSPQNQSYLQEHEEDNNNNQQNPYQSKSNKGKPLSQQQNYQHKENHKDFIVKEEYFSDEEEHSTNQDQNRENKIEQEDVKEKQDDEEYIKEMKQLFVSQQDQQDFNLRFLSDSKNIEKTQDYLSNNLDAQEQDLGIPIGSVLDQYETELENLLNNLNFK